MLTDIFVRWLGMIADAKDGCGETEVAGVQAMDEVLVEVWWDGKDVWNLWVQYQRRVLIYC